MANANTIKQIIQLYKKLGGNVSEIMGTKTNINFIGKGEPEMLSMSINEQALGAFPQSKVIDELKDSVSYAVGDKLNDIQANNLLTNMSKLDNFFNPPAAPANIADLATGTRNLDQEGLMSLRLKKSDDELAAMAERIGLNDPKKNKFLQTVDEADLPPPGSRGGPEDISAPFASAEETIKNLAKSEGVDAAETILPTGKGLELLKNVQNNNLIVNDLVNKIYLNAGVAENAQPVVRANARDFLNRIKDLSDEVEGTTLSGVMEADDFRFMTEGGGGGMGDPLLLVQKYFGPKVASAVAKLDGPNDIQLFAERLISVKDAKGKGVTDRLFNPDTVDISDFEFADGGRVPFFLGGAARLGKASFEALKKYGIEGPDVSRLFGLMSADKTMVGPAKTEYFKQLYKVLKNPDDFPDAIKDIQIKLGIDIGLKRGGLAGILEV